VPQNQNRARGLRESMKIYNTAGIRDLGSIEPGKVTDLTLSGPRRCGEHLEYLNHAWLLDSWGSPPRLPMMLSEVFTRTKDES
jgi:hypothetical protein